MEDVKLQEKIKEFLSIDNGDGSGYGFGDGSGYGYGDGSGDGSGYGFGDGSGSGYGFGDGSGYGFGDGSGGLSEINGHKVYMVDSVPTIFSSIKVNVAKGFILRSDLTMTSCYVVKGVTNGNTVFAHGDDLHKAMTALTDKMFDDMPEEERIAEFVKAHPDYCKPYPNQDLFDWHHRLTGSCEMGRNAFVSDRGLSLDAETTVEQFVELCKNAYGGSTIRKLPGAYGVEVSN